MPEQDDGKQAAGSGGLLDELPLDRVKEGVQDLLGALGERAASVVSEKLEDVTERLTESAGDGGAGLMAAVTGGKELAGGKSPAKAALSAGMAGAKEKVKEATGLGGGAGGGSGGGSEGGAGGGGGKVKVTNIVEEFDVGLPVRVAYDQWTQFQDFPSFTKKVTSVSQESDEKLYWKARIFLSDRSWESTIIEQIPDERIVWRSKGSKGHVDGTVTFHELTADLTRVLLVLEYYPQGFFEKTANLWRAPGRRARLDFKHIKRHMMTKTILEQDEVEGWRGEIRDSEVVRSHEEALKEEKEEYGESEDVDEESQEYAGEEERSATEKGE